MHLIARGGAEVQDEDGHGATLIQGLLSFPLASV
jgi:hypothetical protein